MPVQTAAPVPLSRADGNAPHPHGRIRTWLSKAGLNRYTDVLCSQLSEAEFGRLGMVDFGKFGVTDVAHKQTLFRLIKNLNAEGVFVGVTGDVTGGVTGGVIANDVHKGSVTNSHSTLAMHSPLRDSLSDEAFRLASNVAPGNVRTSHGLLDVHASEHDEFLLSPMAKGTKHSKDPFVPSPTTGKDNTNAQKKESPLEQLRKLSRENRGANDVTSSGPVVEQTTQAAAQTDPPTVKETGVDPSKMPFVVDAMSKGPKNISNTLSASEEIPQLTALPKHQPRIRVVVRKRPLNSQELGREETDVVTVDTVGSTGENSASNNSRTIPTTSSLTVWEPKTKVDLTEYTETHKFVFDDVYDPDVSNDTVYNSTVAPLVGTIFDKCKVTCFAYGQTGSGKTYTMNPLPIRAAGEILGELRKPEYKDLCLKVSYFEIYGGKVYDLLNGRAKLVIREDARSQMCVVGLKEFEVEDVGLVHQLIDHGAAARCVGSTGANAESSRSHAIMQFVLKKRSDIADDEMLAKGVPASVIAQRKKQSPNHALIHGKFSFIDLAGSERGADTDQNDAKTRLEGAEINKSLLALKECIRALDRGTGHVPFRGSKLTEVLRDSFMGNSRTVMIANISPATGSCEHTLNTLRYAYRVKELRSGGDADTASNAPSSTHRTALAPDGVTPVGILNLANLSLQSDAKTQPSGFTSARDRGSQSRINRVMSAGGNVSVRGGLLRSTFDASDTAETEKKPSFDPKAAAKAAAARVQATRKSAEADSLALQKKESKPFLTRGGGGLGGTYGGLLSPRKERPKSALPSRGSTATYTERLMGKGNGGSPMKLGKQARPQTARVGNARHSLAPSDTTGRPSTSARRRETFASVPEKLKEQPIDPRTDAFKPNGGKQKPPVAKIEKINEDAVSEQTRSPVKKNSVTVDSAVTNDEPHVTATSPGSLKLLTGSALAAAQARAFQLGHGPPVDQTEMAKAHDDLINVILEEEEDVIGMHRGTIESTMDLVKKEMGLLAEVDKPGSAIDVYVEMLADVLEKKLQSIQQLQSKVKQFQTHLKEEEVLSKAVGLH